jgi:hypothetical protein
LKLGLITGISEKIEAFSIQKGFHKKMVYERERWFQNDLWFNKSVQSGSVQNVSIRLMRFHEI